MWYVRCFMVDHYDDVIMGAIASQITSLTIVYSTVYSGADQSKHQSSASLAFVWGIHRGPVNSPHKWPVTRKVYPFDDVIMLWYLAMFWVCRVPLCHTWGIFYGVRQVVNCVCSSTCPCSSGRCSCVTTQMSCSMFCACHAGPDCNNKQTSKQPLLYDNEFWEITDSEWSISLEVHIDFWRYQCILLHMKFYHCTNLKLDRFHHRKCTAHGYCVFHRCINSIQWNVYWLKWQWSWS